jgi:hypothetical protein
MRAEKHFGNVFYHDEILIDDEIRSHILLKLRNIKFHENAFSASRFVACRYTDLQTNVAKLIRIFSEDFVANKCKKNKYCCPCIIIFSILQPYTNIYNQKLGLKMHFNQFWILRILIITSNFRNSINSSYIEIMLYTIFV